MQRVPDSFCSIYEKGLSLWMENSDIHYRSLHGVLTREEVAVLRDLRAQIVAALRGPRSAAVPPLLVSLEPSDLVPLAFQQEAYIGLVEKEVSANLWLTCAVRLVGALSIEVLRKSFETIVWRHDSLRTRIVRINGVPTQRIDAPKEFRLESVTIAGASTVDAESRARDCLTALLVEPADMAVGPLFKVFLLKLAEHEHVLALVVHHVISDATSVLILLRELRSFYGDFARGRKPLLRRPLQYSDYTIWQREAHLYFRERNESYWTRRIEGARPMVFPTDKVSEAVKPNAAAQLQISFDEVLSSALRDLVRREKIVPGIAILAAYAAAASAWLERRDLLVYFTVSGRVSSDQEDIVGCLVDGLLLRIDLNGDETFLDLIRIANQEFLTALEHMDIRALGKVSNVSRLLPDPWILQWAPWFPGELPGGRQWDETDSSLLVEPFPVSADLWIGKEVPYGAALHFFDGVQGICARVGYRADLFSEGTIRRFLQTMRATCERMVRDPSDRVALSE